MFFQTLLMVMLGILIGTVAGLCPGIHINSTIPLILSLSYFIGEPLNLAVLIVTVSITEMFMDQIPAIFIGAPDEGTALSVLPGHRLLMQGKGQEALLLTVIGGIGSLIVTILVILIFSSHFTKLYDITRPYIHFAILGVIVFMILSEGEPAKMTQVLFILAISGIFGIITLNTPLVNNQDVLFPVFTGMFGMSGLVISYNESSSIPEQNPNNVPEIKKLLAIKAIAVSSIAGILVGFLPAVGISEAALIVQYLAGGGVSGKYYLITTAGVNTANDLFSLISLHLIGNPRSGASVAIQKILGELGGTEAIYLISASLLASGISAMFTLFLGRKVQSFLTCIDYRLVTKSILFLLASLVFITTGLPGLLVLVTSTSIGLLCVYLGAKRSSCMGVLLVPTLMFYLGIDPIVISMLGF